MIFFVEANFASNSNAIFYECADEEHVKSRGRFRHIIVPSVLKINQGKEL